MLTLYDEFMKVRLTVTLPKQQVDAVRREVEAGRAASVSEYVSQALGSCLGSDGGENTRRLKPMAEAVSEILGRPLTADEQAWLAGGPDDLPTWEEVMREILDESGGPPTDEEIAWVQGVLEGTIDASERP